MCAAGGQRAFPTFDDIFKRIKSDKRISTAHIYIVYFDSALNKFMDKRFAAWKDIQRGGDIPVHRVYFIKYKDIVIWDRKSKECTIDSIISERNNLPQRFRILSYNILNNETLCDRIGGIVDYIINTNADVVCLQEVSNILLEKLKILPQYELVVTDLKDNNVAFISKCKIDKTDIISMKGKQALKIIINDQNDMPVQFIGLHLTSDHQQKADDKRKEQLATIISNIDTAMPVFIMGDFNIAFDKIPQLY
jgi:uncharacterized protein (UPF0248 family)